MKKYHLITIGCQMNKSDSERMAAVLESQGLKKTDKRKSADLIVLVTCGVRQSAEDRIYGLVNQIKKDNQKTKIVLTGCLAGRADVKSRLTEKVDFWVPIGLISNFQFPISPSAPLRAGKFQIPKIISKKLNCEYLNIVPKYTSKFSAFVPIGNGCDNFCSYCVVPYARGREVYRPVEEIIKEVKSLIKKGYKEINLIAQNVNSYQSKVESRKQ